MFFSSNLPDILHETINLFINQIFISHFSKLFMLLEEICKQVMFTNFINPGSLLIAGKVATIKILLATTIKFAGARIQVHFKFSQEAFFIKFVATEVKRGKNTQTSLYSGITTHGRRNSALWRSSQDMSLLSSTRPGSRRRHSRFPRT